MRYLISFLLPILAFGGWSEVRTGPFEVVTDAGDKEARLTLNYLEQLRHAIGTAVGQPDLPSVWPIRVIVLKNEKAATNPELKFGRDAWVASIHDINPRMAASVTDVLLRSWPGYVPPNLRRGLLRLYSTLDVDRTVVELGRPPAVKDRDWSRAHMLAVHPDYSGRLRVLLANLGKGIETDVAYKNAFEKTPAEIDKALDAYIAAGEYGTIPVSGKAISAQRQFVVKDMEDKAAAVVLADLTFANGGDPGYEKLGITEGQGLVALRKGDKAAAMKLLEQATSAYALVEYAKLLPQDQRRPVLEKAAAANPKWAEPYKLMAVLEVHPAQKLAALRKATQLDPNDPEMWVLMARTQESAKQMADAARSWAAAERTTDDPNKREEMRQLRAAGERARARADMEAREEARRKTQQELEDLKNRALMEIRKAEARANAGKPVIDDSKLDVYKEGPTTERISGVLTRVDCKGSEATLHVQTGRSVMRLSIPDPATVEIAGGGEKSFACGVQKPARKVNVDYEPGDAKKVTRIEFR